MKVARTVWSGGKLSDYFKELPITMKMQNMVEVSIRGLAARGDNYKQIYKDTNQTLENYSRLSLIAERFLPA